MPQIFVNTVGLRKSASGSEEIKNNTIEKVKQSQLGFRPTLKENRIINESVIVNLKVNYVIGP